MSDKFSPFRLRVARAARGLNQGELGVSTGAVDGASVSRYEQGVRMPTPGTVEKLCYHLGVPSGFLYGEGSLNILESRSNDESKLS
jgi:transcriptional regulator with XRE-family HTH domain